MEAPKIQRLIRAGGSPAQKAPSGHQEASRRISAPPPVQTSMRDSSGSEKEKGMAAVKAEMAKTCMLMWRMLDLVPSEDSRSAQHL